MAPKSLVSGRFTLRYELRDAGWGRAWIGDGATEIEIETEWDWDPLADLLRSACFLYEGGRDDGVYRTDTTADVEFRTWFDGDHTLVWEVPIVPASEMRGRLVSKSGIGWDFEDGSKERVLPVATTVGEYASIVRSVAGELLERHGFEGYARRWGSFDFPLGWFARLSRLLGAEALTVPLGDRTPDPPSPSEGTDR